MNALVLPTDREEVVLRQLSVEDAPAYFESVDNNREHLSQFGDTTAAKYQTLDDVAESIKNPSNPSKIRMGIWDGGTFVGSANLSPDEDRRATELGYWVDGRYLRKGYASLAAKALSKYGLEQFGRVYAHVASELTETGEVVNTRSVGVLEKAGFRNIAKNVGQWVFEILPGFEAPDQNFEEQLAHAFAHPLRVSLGERRGISPEEAAERERYFARHRELPDESPVFIAERRQKDYEAWTFEHDKYALLIAQAMRHLELVKGNPDPGIVITPTVRKSADHEVAHARMGESIGVASALVVRALHDPGNNIWAVGPAHVLLGPAHITKLEDAAISAAPEDASEGDMISVLAAGYTSREEVLAKFNATRR